MAYTTVAQVRSLPYVGNQAYTDEVIQEGIDYATDMIDSYTGTTFEAKPQTFQFNGNGSSRQWLDVPFITTITSVTEDGVSLDEAEFSVSGDGFYLCADEQVFYTDSLYVVVATGGQYATPPKQIEIAARTIAAKYVKGLHTALPDGSIQVVTDRGTILVAQPGVRGPTGIPEVNSILNRYIVEARYF